MLDSRREILKALTGAAGLLVAASWVGAEGQMSPQPMESPNAPRNQNAPAGMNPELVKPDKAPLSPMNQVQIGAEVKQLFKLATELRDEFEQTNLTTTFSLAFVKKAQQIEKLAKQIKDKAKG